MGGALGLEPPPTSCCTRAFRCGASTALDLFAEICAVYLESPMFVHGSGCVLYDPLAMAMAGQTPWTRFETIRTL